MLSLFEQVVKEINEDTKVINEKHVLLSQLQLSSLKNIVDLIIKYLKFDIVENITKSSQHMNFYNVGSLISACSHAIKLGEYKGIYKNYLKDTQMLNENLYEIWLLRNKEFCVTRLIENYCKETQKITYTREIVEYSYGIFETHSNKTFWNIDDIIKSLMDNIKETAFETKNMRTLLDHKLEHATKLYSLTLTSLADSNLSNDS